MSARAGSPVTYMHFGTRNYRDCNLGISAIFTLMIGIRSHSRLACRKITESTICASRFELQDFELDYVSLCSTHSDSGQIRALKDFDLLKDIAVRFG